MHALLLLTLLATPQEDFEAASALRSAEKFEEAAAAFTAIAGRDPTGSLASDALLNAAICHEKVGRTASARLLLRRVVSEYPRGPNVDEALFRLARLAEKSSEPEVAINVYLELASKRSGSTWQADAMFNAAVLHESLGHFAAAAELFERYAKLYAARAEAPATSLRAAQLYQRAGDALRERDALRSYLRSVGAQNGAATNSVKARLEKLPP